MLAYVVPIIDDQKATKAASLVSQAFRCCAFSILWLIGQEQDLRKRLETSTQVFLKKGCWYELSVTAEFSISQLESVCLSRTLNIFSFDLMACNFYELKRNKITSLTIQLGDLVVHPPLASAGLMGVNELSLIPDNDDKLLKRQELLLAMGGGERDSIEDRPRPTSFYHLMRLSSEIDRSSSTSDWQLVTQHVLR